LFDEADSLFGKRTAVTTSTDRYANLEVNFLLQRLESFTGISILTSNHEAAIDDAFKRRLSFRIAFPVPDAKERASIWQAMLPPRARYAGDLGIAKLAEAFNMSGGYIKNAIVRAAFIAADRGEAITHKDLLRGAKMEYTAMGKISHG
jgi:SpoVK/Ycf46/Vps4 family AAA+-type ATPase